MSKIIQKKNIKNNTLCIIADIIIIGITLLVIDMLYLNLIKETFKKQIEEVQSSPMKINISAAAICYVFLIFGLYYFVIRENKSYMYAFLLGIVIYGVYETTSMALLQKWKWQTVIMDTLWGGILFAITTLIFKEIKKIY